MNSMRQQMLFISFISVFILLGISAIILTHYYTESIQDNIEAQLKSRVYTLLEAAEYNQQGQMRLPEFIAVPDLNHVHSGTYAQVQGENKHYHWLSASIAGLAKKLPDFEKSKMGEMLIQRKQNYHTLNFRFSSEDNQGVDIQYQMMIYIDATPYQHKISQFKQQLLFMLIMISGCLLVIQWLVFFWGLKPLNRMIAEIKAVEEGKQKQLKQTYPIELQLLTETLNSLIQYSHTNLRRYRNSLGDLAHSLKTPVAVLQAIQESDEIHILKAHLKIEIPRIHEIIDYQLKRAKVGGAIVGTKTNIEPIARRIKKVMGKIYPDMEKNCQINIAENCFFYGDKADLMELLGNLMDNAWKHGGNQIIVSAYRQNKKLYLTIEDNGQKLTAVNLKKLSQRGIKLDEKTEGQGLGLNLVQDIINIYDGKINLTQSMLSGLKIEIIL